MRLGIIWYGIKKWFWPLTLCLFIFLYLIHSITVQYFFSVKVPLYLETGYFDPPMAVDIGSVEEVLGWKKTSGYKEISKDPPTYERIPRYDDAQADPDNPNYYTPLRVLEFSETPSRGSRIYIDFGNWQGIDCNNPALSAAAALDESYYYIKPRLDLKNTYEYVVRKEYIELNSFAGCPTLGRRWRSLVKVNFPISAEAPLRIIVPERMEARYWTK
jgi:hypothetical protein